MLPQILKILFKVLANSEDSMLRLEILKDTLGLLEANPLNSEALTLVCFLSHTLFTVIHLVHVVYFPEVAYYWVLLMFDAINHMLSHFYTLKMGLEIFVSVK